jgi:hypothetical protein
MMPSANAWFGSKQGIRLMEHPREDQYSAEETEQRLQKILQGAFSGPPTPLKDIPTKSGESRKLQRKKPQRRRLRRQRKKRAA